MSIRAVKGLPQWKTACQAVPYSLPDHKAPWHPRPCYHLTDAGFWVKLGGTCSGLVCLAFGATVGVESHMQTFMAMIYWKFMPLMINRNAFAFALATAFLWTWPTPAQ